MKTTQIKEGYVENVDVPQFDDRDLTEQWQAGVYMFSSAIVANHPYRDVIDVGCGSGWKLKKYFPYANTIGVDNNASTLEYLNNAYPSSFWMSPDQLDEFLDKSYDEGDVDEDLFCICSDAIEHTDNPVEFFESILRIPWHQMVISTPERDLGNEPDGPPGNIHHRMEWNFAEFRAFLQQWEDQVTVKLHCVINPEQRTQMAWLERTSSVTQDETESQCDPGCGGSMSGSALL